MKASLAKAVQVNIARGQANRSLVRAFIASHPGVTADVASKALGLSKAHVVRLGRGMWRANRKLTREQVEAIRCRLKEGEFRAILAHEYGVKKVTIENIEKGVSWRQP